MIEPSRTPTEPRIEVERRLAARRGEVSSCARLDGRLSNIRLAVFAAGVVVAWFTFGTRHLAPIWVGGLAAAFLVLVVWHDRAIRERRRAERGVALYEAGLAHLDGTWPGTGTAGEERRGAEHPYAEDLDVFGRGSLFERLCTARTRQGEDVLAAWLRGGAAPEEIRARQAAVAELRDRIDLREDLTLLGEDVRSSLHAEQLRQWGETQPVLSGGVLRALAALLPALSVAALLGAFFAGIGLLPAQIALLAQGLFAWRMRSRVRRALHGLDLPARDLSLLSALLARLESEQFSAPRLVGLRGVLDTEGQAASASIARLRLAVDLLDARRNQFFAPIGLLLLWSTQIAFAVESWRAQCGRRLGPWIEATGEFEALAALSAYAWECPDHRFPEIVTDGPAPRFEAIGLGHPLLPEDRRIRNDLAFGDPTRVVIVSGSNMSGKSTLLRAVGANAVLALMGAPVCARALRISSLRLGASIQVRDSLLEGRSRFYAEIQRLRQIMALAEEGEPLLFLLDEILHGTNSHDRGIGAEAVVRGLLERGAAGLVTTHDLALTRMAEGLGTDARNVHFEDQVENGQMAFDYQLRPGVVSRGNALELMRAIGLPV